MQAIEEYSTETGQGYSERARILSEEIVRHCEQSLVETKNLVRIIKRLDRQCEAYRQENRRLRDILSGSRRVFSNPSGGRVNQITNPQQIPESKENQVPEPSTDKVTRRTIPRPNPLQNLKSRKRQVSKVETA